MQAEPTNLVPNGDFQAGKVGDLPDAWSFTCARPQLAPVFKLVDRDGCQCLMATGDGNPDCVGHVHASTRITLGKTYLFRAVFRMSDDLNPHQHLLFLSFGPGASDGIFEFRRRDDGWVEGSVKIHYPGDGEAVADVRVLFRLSAHGKVWVRQVSLVETEPVSPQWVTVACTQGKTNMEDCVALLDAAGEQGVDLVLLPEAMAGMDVEERVPGPASELMSRKASQYGMHVAGGIIRIDEETNRVLNTALLYDRQGQFVGMYDKVHPYSPEINELGTTPGSAVPTFDTDIGRIGIIICYDSWFTDVVELLGLKGAQIVLLPNAGYYRSLMPARSADNCLRMVVSSWGSGYGVWDTAGRDVLAPETDHTCRPLLANTFQDAKELAVGDHGMLIVSLDLNCSPSPAGNGGTMMSAPGGRRNRREQSHFLDEEIVKERSRWWVE